VKDIDSIFNKFLNLLNIGGYLAIADLYREDGSFHGKGFDGHLGFDVEYLCNKLRILGFNTIRHQHCHTMAKEDEASNIKEYPIFLLTALKEK
jgi:hypothetical protein